MKIMITSDIHGSAYYLRQLLERYKIEQPDKLLFLGDILYHGPRNDLPKGYAPKEVIELLNAIKEDILCVRGNCDTDVDQMVLEFPMMADYALLVLNGRIFYATHGHIYNKEVLPPMQPGDVLIHGHIHLPVAEPMGDGYLLNPGSVSLPKGGSPNSYGILDEHVFTIYDFEGNKVKEISL